MTTDPLPKGRVHLSALAYDGERLVGIELDHRLHPESADRWEGRGLCVEVVEEAEALRRWRAALPRSTVGNDAP